MSNPVGAALPSKGDATDPEVRNALVALLRTGGAVLFAGAGCSVPAAFPIWPRLLDHLAVLCQAHCPEFEPNPDLRDNDLLLYAEVIQGTLATVEGGTARYETELYNIFGAAPRLTSFHRDLAELPFTGAITTNYDSTIEVAFGDLAPNPPDVCVDLSQAHPRTVHSFLNGLSLRKGRRVAHIHGHYLTPSGIVLSRSDYQRAYHSVAVPQDRVCVPTFLRFALSMLSLVFIGFSFNDDEQLMTLLETASRENRLEGSQTHFAIMATTPERQDEHRTKAARMRERFGIETLFADNADRSFSGVYELVRDLRQRVAPRPTSMQLNEKTAEAMVG